MSVLPSENQGWLFLRHCSPMNFHTGCPESSVKFSSVLASWGQHSSEIKQAAHRTEELSSPWSRTRQPLPSVCVEQTSLWPAVACSICGLPPLSPPHASPHSTAHPATPASVFLEQIKPCWVWAFADYLHKLLTNRSWHGSFAPSCRAQPKCHLLGDLPLTQSLSYHVAWFSS